MESICLKASHSLSTESMQVALQDTQDLSYAFM